MQKNVESSLLTELQFLPLSLTMENLTGRTDDQTNNLLTGENPEDTYVSLIDIITNLRDNDKVGVYMIKPGGELPACQPKGLKKQFCSIHVKQVMYEGEECTAVYFCCMTHHVDAMKFQSTIIEERNRNETMESYTSTISHEFRTPLATSVMFLDQLLNLYNNNPAALKIIKLVMSQLQFLLSLVNDLLDIKMIEKGVFEPKYDHFNITETLDFILQMFSQQAEMSENELSYKTLQTKSLDEAYDINYNEIMLEKGVMPENLIGDAIRLK